MAKLAVFIHGMWGTPDVWRNWRAFLEARGWQTWRRRCATTTRRRSSRRPRSAPPACSTMSPISRPACAPLPEKPVVVGHSMGGLIALLLCARGWRVPACCSRPHRRRACLRSGPPICWPSRASRRHWGWWRKPHRATLAGGPVAHLQHHGAQRGDAASREASCTIRAAPCSRWRCPGSTAPRRRRRGAGRRHRAAAVRGGGEGQARPALRWCAASPVASHGSTDYHEYPGQGHWVLGQPGWQQIAADAAQWMDRQWRSSTSPN